MIDYENKELIEELLSLSRTNPDDLILYLDNKHVQERIDFTECKEAIFISLCQYNNKKLLNKIVLRYDLNNVDFKNKIGFKAIMYSLNYSSFEVLNYLIFEYGIDEDVIDWEIKIDGLNIVRNMFLARKLNYLLHHNS